MQMMPLELSDVRVLVPRGPILFNYLPDIKAAMCPTLSQEAQIGSLRYQHQMCMDLILHGSQGMDGRAL